MASKEWRIYLSGEIHSDWREQIVDGCGEKSLPVSFSAPVTNHDASDMVGVNILGAEDQNFWRDRKGAGINAIRTSSLIGSADVVVVRFGPKYKQWNGRFRCRLRGCARQGTRDSARPRARSRAQRGRRRRPCDCAHARPGRRDPRLRHQRLIDEFPI